jgi:hypothetical protein
MLGYGIGHLAGVTGTNGMVVLLVFWGVFFLLPVGLVAAISHKLPMKWYRWLISGILIIALAGVWAYLWPSLVKGAPFDAVYHYICGVYGWTNGLSPMVFGLVGGAFGLIGLTYGTK